jgi:hypothetical protein
MDRLELSVEPATCSIVIRWDQLFPYELAAKTLVDNWDSASSQPRERLQPEAANVGIVELLVELNPFVTSHESSARSANLGHADRLCLRHS